MGIIGTLWVGAGMIGVMMSSQTYLVDAFQRHAASAIAANTVLRSLVGAFLPLAGPKLYASLGLGWGNSRKYTSLSSAITLANTSPVLAFIALALSPIALLFYTKGEKIRTKYAVQF